MAGRAPSDEDREGGLAVAVINRRDRACVVERCALRALGQHIKLGGPYMEGAVLEIVGVAANVPQEGLDSPPLPQIYLPSAQRVESCNGDHDPDAWPIPGIGREQCGRHWLPSIATFPFNR